jgi:hypothetical protein
LVFFGRRRGFCEPGGARDGAAREGLVVPLVPDVAIALCLGGVVLALRDPNPVPTEQSDISRLTAH